MLTLFASSKAPKLCQRAVKDWAKSTVQQAINKEVNTATRSGDLRITDREINSSFASSIGFEELKAMVRRHCPSFLGLLADVITTSRQAGGASMARLAAKEHAAAFVILNLLGARSQKNSYAQHVMGLYLYSTGASRQQISVMNHLGMSVSYVTLAGQGNKAENLLTSKTDLATLGLRKHRLGTLEALSESMRKETRKVASSNLYGLVYDNINMVWKVAEQIIGRTDSMENGTCATLVSLFCANVEDLKAVALERGFHLAPELKVSDIVLTKDEYTFHCKCLIHTVLRIAVQNGGPRLQVFRKELQAMEPRSKFQIEVHKSEIYPLPAMNINKASTVRNAEELSVDTSKPEFCGNLRLIAGDQLSIARLRAVLAARAGNEGGASSLRWAVFIPGLFHCKIAATNGFLQTHFGHPNRDLTDPASLSSHNTLLQRKPIILSSLPPFRTCRDLIFVSLYARVLHCLLKVSGADSLDSFSDGLTWDVLCGHAEAVVDTFSDAHMVDTLRCSRHQESQSRGEQEGGSRRAGDMIFENAVLFLRDGLILREFSDAIKCGDSGRVLLVLKIWALSFRGSRRTKYAYEVLHLVHNITHVWPKPVVKIVLNNWLVNPTGKENSFVELDLMQEHLNYWIKNYYQAHGSGASWEWLATISPCIEVLWQLASEVNGALGSKQGNRHATPDLTKDIKILMDSLKKNNVYNQVLGRTLGDEEKPAPDIICEGFTALTWGAKSPLKQFNQMIKTLQRCCSIQPLVGTTAPTQTPDTHMERALDETQPMLSLETADDVDLKMDADLLIHADPLDEGDETDISEGDGTDGLV
ncbi:hypothetical protein V8E53_011594 [Lactarius tabidus]